LSGAPLGRNAMRLPGRRRSPKKVTLPEVEPVIPVLGAQPFDDPAWVFEPKYDGCRGLLYLNAGECWIRSKRGHLLKRFDELCFVLPDFLDARDAILDGEVLALDEQGRPVFRDLFRSRAGTLAYAVFDLLWLNGRDLRGWSLGRRKARLERVLKWQVGPILRILTVEKRGRELFEAVQRLDLEGIIAKRKADPYGPDTIWYKIRNPAYTQMEGRRELFERRR
jgi:bifunctional non-homologous end joining protein LigD